jgi:hypothetical protein
MSAARRPNPALAISLAACLLAAAGVAGAASPLRPDRRELPGVKKAWKRAEKAHGRNHRARVFRETTVEVALSLHQNWSRQDAEKALAETKKASISDIAALLAGELGHPRFRKTRNQTLLFGLHALNEQQYYRGYNYDQTSNQLSKRAREIIRTGLHIADYIQREDQKPAAETSRMERWVGIYDAAREKASAEDRTPFLHVLLEASEWAEMLINGD